MDRGVKRLPLVGVVSTKQIMIFFGALWLSFFLTDNGQSYLALGVMAAAAFFMFVKGKTFTPFEYIRYQLAFLNESEHSDQYFASTKAGAKAGRSTGMDAVADAILDFFERRRRKQ
jgi:hypothetical protein